MSKWLQRVLMTLTMLLMGNVSGMSNREKWAQAIEDGEKAIFGEGEPAPNAEPEPKPEPAPAAEPEPHPVPAPAPAADNAELETLRQENSRLRAQIDDENGQTYRAKYATLQGMFSKTNEEIKSLKEQLAELKAKPVIPAAPAPADTAEYDSLVAEVGEKAAKIIMAREEKSSKHLKDALETVNGELAATRGEVKTAAEVAASTAASQAVTAQDRFFTNLDAVVPGWKDLNGWDGKPMDPKFSAFLDGNAPGTNLTYNQLMSSNCAQGSVTKVAEIFQLFREKNPAPAVPAVPAKPSLEDHLDVGKTGKGGAAPVDKDKKPIIPKSEADAFYRNYRTLKNSKTPDELAKMEAMYDTAAAENRINFNA